MSGKSIRLELPTDNPIGSTPGHQGTAGHAEDHDKIREILAVLVDGFVPGKLGDLADVNTDAVGDGVGAGYALVWDGGKFAPVDLPTPVTGALVSGATLRLQYPDGSYTDVVLPVNTGPAGVAGAAGRGISSLQFSDVNGDRHLNVIYSDDPNNPVDVGPVPRGVPGSNGVDGRSLTSAAVNGAGRLILTYSDGSTVDAGNVVGPAGVGSFADSFRGQWSASTAYAKNDIVSYGGDSYFLRVASNTGTAPTDNATSATWAVLSLNGAKGDVGSQGPIGPSPVLSVGPVTTLDAGASGSATLTGTPAAPILNLSLPRGAAGLDGARGVDGAQGAPGNTGAPGRGVTALALSATNVLTVTYNDGTSSTVGTIATVKGDPGTPGAAGASAQLSIGTVTTLTAGTPATATVTGTGPAYVLNLGLPVAAGGASLPTPTAAGQVLTATGTTSGAYAFTAPAVPPGTVRGLWSTSGTYAVGDVVSFAGALYQASAVSGGGSGNVILDPLTTGTTAPAGILTNGVVNRGAAGATISSAGSIYREAAPSGSLDFSVDSVWTASGEPPMIFLGTGGTSAPADIYNTAARSGVIVVSHQTSFIYVDYYAANGSGTIIAQTTFSVGTVKTRTRIQVTADARLTITVTQGTQVVTPLSDYALAGRPTTYRHGVYNKGVQNVTWSAFNSNVSAATAVPTPAQSGSFFPLTLTVSAWTAVTPTAPATASTTSPPQYRTNGDRVELRGAFTAVTATAGTATAVATLPAGFRPPTDVLTTAAISTTGKVVSLLITAAGVVSVLSDTALSGVTLNVTGVNFSTTP